jgi:hypothetical protein
MEQDNNMSREKLLEELALVLLKKILSGFLNLFSRLKMLVLAPGLGCQYLTLL